MKYPNLSLAIEVPLQSSCPNHNPNSALDPRPRQRSPQPWPQQRSMGRLEITDSRRKCSQRNRRHRPVRHCRWGHPGCRRLRLLDRLHRWEPRSPVLSTAKALRLTKGSSLSASCCCSAPYCLRHRSRPLKQAWPHRRTPRTPSGLRISSDSPPSFSRFAVPTRWCACASGADC